ncbi:PRC-barrel domain-containing protein [Streptomyces sp. NA04227]|uniref:PRC-barrel domain-containing protein n=1 Tax=Streptomyces sp. NA04227 TaxID=2742136 RepID=UPI001590FF3F|nr:PRC-barrel domain-containing protein [Streptomyces sp. NA04227]QKW10750.1 PRC-barrel domain-containing protein [Streptomyces sp. NA04227]
MVEVVSIREWVGHDVVDEEKRKIGSLEAIYVDTASDEPSFATVTIGLPLQRKLVFVPLGGAKVGPGYLQVAYGGKLVKSCPSMDVDGELLADDEPQVFEHYELPYHRGASGERRLARR